MTARRQDGLQVSDRVVYLSSCLIIFVFQNRCRHAFMGPECASSRHSKLFTSIQVASCIMVRVQDLGLSREGHKEVPACL